MSDNNLLTAKQAEIVNSLCEVHGLEPNQISFHENESTPIFDYEAICYLSVVLTDIQDMDTQIVEINEDFAKAKCTVTLSDGRTRSVEDLAEIGELIGKDPTRIKSPRLAQQVARSRAARLGIRSVGVNLFNAHQKFIETGEIANGHTNHDPRYPHYQTIKTIAKKIGLIVTTKIDGKTVEEKSEYEKVLSQNLKVKSLKDLTDKQLQRAVVLFRTLERLAKIQSKETV